MPLVKYTVPAYPEGLNRWVKFVDTGQDPAVTHTRQISLTSLISDEMEIMAAQIVGFSIEAYTFKTGTGLNERVRTLYQLVGFGDGPGWGPDLTLLKDAHRYTTTIPQDAIDGALVQILNQRYDPAKNPSISTGNLLGATAGKYVLQLGLPKASLQEDLDYLFQRLDGAPEKASS